MQDKYGRNVIVTSTRLVTVYEVYPVGSDEPAFALSFPATTTEARALYSINAHQPEGWVEPPADPVPAQEETP